MRHIASHTGLRGIAALLVVFYHFQFGAAYLLPFEAATSFFVRSYLCVDLFFVLSGFVISFANDADSRGAFSIERSRRFMIARLARIYPLHLFCLLYFALFLTSADLAFQILGKDAPYDAWQGEGPAQFAAQLFLVHSWLPLPPAWNIPSWSISAELVAYLLFPLIVTLHVWAKWGTQLGLLAIAGLFYGWVATTTGDLDIVNVQAPLRCVAGFGLGMLVYFYRASIERCGTTLLSALQILACLVVIFALAFPVNDVLIVPGFVLLVAATWPDRGIVARFLGLRPMTFLGEISYSVYLNHVCIITIFSFFWGRLAPRLPIEDPAIVRILYLAIVTTCILLVSAWTFRAVEAPARAFVTRRLLKREPRLPADIPTAP